MLSFDRANGEGSQGRWWCQIGPGEAPEEFSNREIPGLQRSGFKTERGLLSELKLLSYWLNTTLAAHSFTSNAPLRLTGNSLVKLLDGKGLVEVLSGIPYQNVSCVAFSGKPALGAKRRYRKQLFHNHVSSLF